MSIRYKIFGVFSVVILLACGLAFYGIRGISTAGDLVVRLYDGPLMGINHARSAHAGAERGASHHAAQPDRRGDGRSGREVRKAGSQHFRRSQRGPGPGRRARSVKAAREKAEAGLRDWSGAGLKILKPVPGGLTEIPTTFSLTQQGDDAVAAARRSRGTGRRLWLRLPHRGGSIGRGGAHHHAGDRRRHRADRIHARDRLCLFAEQADLRRDAGCRTRGGRQFRRRYRGPAARRTRPPSEVACRHAGQPEGPRRSRISR